MYVACTQQCAVRLGTIVGLTQDWGTLAELDVDLICGTQAWLGLTLAYSRAGTEGRRRRSLAGEARHKARGRARLEKRLAAGLGLKGEGKGDKGGKGGKGDKGAA